MGVAINKKSTTTEPQNHRLRTDSSLSHRGGGGGGGLNAFYWYQIFALDSAVVEVQEMFSSHGSHASNVKVFNLSKFLSLIIKFAVASSYLKNLLERFYICNVQARKGLQRKKSRPDSPISHLCCHLYRVLTLACLLMSCTVTTLVSSPSYFASIAGT